jgi:hypothetical protein
VEQSFESLCEEMVRAKRKDAVYAEGISNGVTQMDSLRPFASAETKNAFGPCLVGLVVPTHRRSTRRRLGRHRAGEQDLSRGRLWRAHVACLGGQTLPVAPLGLAAHDLFGQLRR